MAKNGNIYNIWTLDLSTGELRQYTDALGGNWSAVVLNEGRTSRIAFVTYYKGEFGIHTLERKEPLHTAASADFGAPGPIIDFQAPLQHTLVKENDRKKGTFEKMFLEGRPPVNVGVTSNGDMFGGSQISFGDVLGDQQFNFYAASISQYRTLSLSYVNLSRRFQFALQGYSQTQFFYGQQGGVYIDPAYSPFISRDAATATRTVRGGTVFGIYPLDRYRRLELSGGFVQLNESYNDPALQQLTQQYQQKQYGPPDLQQRDDGAARRRLHPGDDDLPGVRPAGRQHDAPGVRRRAEDREHAVAPDDRRRRAALPADRIDGRPGHAARGFKSIGDAPDFLYFGGNSELRGYDYLQFAGQNTVFANAELRFPLIEAALTPIGVIGGIRGVFFAGVGGAWFNSQPSNQSCTGSSGLQAGDQPADGLPVGDRLPEEPGHRQPDSRCGGPADPHPGARADHHRLPPAGRPRVLRPRARNLRARLPHPLRLVLAHAVQQGLGGRGVCRPERLQHDRHGLQRRVAQAALRGLDWLRLLAGRCSA